MAFRITTYGNYIEVINTTTSTRLLWRQKRFTGYTPYPNTITPAQDYISFTDGKNSLNFPTQENRIFRTDIENGDNGNSPFLNMTELNDYLGENTGANFNPPAGGSAGLDEDNVFTGINTFNQDVNLATNAHIIKPTGDLNIETEADETTISIQSAFGGGVSLSDSVDFSLGTGGNINLDNGNLINVADFQISTVTAAPNVIDPLSPTYLAPGFARFVYNSSSGRLTWYFNNAGTLESNV